MRLLLDEHIDKSVASELRSRGLDVVAVTEDQSLVRWDDTRLLAHAFRDRRAIVTYDVADFRSVTRERSAIDEEGHFGVILLHPRRFRQGKRYTGALIAALEQLLTELVADDALVDREVWLG